MITNNFWRIETHDTLRRFQNGALMDSVKDMTIPFFQPFFYDIRCFISFHCDIRDEQRLL